MAPTPTTSIVRGLGSLLMLLIAVPAAAATVAGFFGDGWWLFDVAASFRAQYIVILLVAGILYGWAAGWTGGTTFLLLAIVNAFVVAPLYLSRPAAAAFGVDDRLEVIVFNVQAVASNRVQVMDWLDDNPADVVVLVESSSEWEAAVERAGLPYAILGGPLPGRSFGVTVLAAPGTDVVNRNYEGDQVIEVTVSMGDEEVTVFALHPQAPTRPDAAAANRELLQTVGTLARETSGHVVVAGDLNATPWSAAYEELLELGDLVDSSLGFGLQPTWPTSPAVARIPIDHVAHGNSLTTVSRRVGPDLGSDHLPLVVVLTKAA